MDQTVTPMGSRLLRKWLVLPLKEKAAIDERLNIVDAFVHNIDLQDQLIHSLQSISDLERLVSKVSVGRISPRELVHLKKSLQHIIPVKENLERSSIVELKKLKNQLNHFIPQTSIKV